MRQRSLYRRLLKLNDCFLLLRLGGSRHAQPHCRGASCVLGSELAIRAANDAA